jgi:DNA-directed RNA polymerase subunit RPC12/RpoP
MTMLQKVKGLLLAWLDMLAEPPKPEIVCVDCKTSDDVALYYEAGYEAVIVCERCGKRVFYLNTVAVERRV